MTWTNENLQAGHSNVKLKSLIDELFERIFPHGVSQLVEVPTHAQQGVAVKCYHLYVSNPEKLSELSADFTGMSDHKLIKVSRYSKKLKPNPRYVWKRSFKNFTSSEFIKQVGEMPELEQISFSQCANQAAELPTVGLSRVLDKCAPIRTIQHRSKYAPHLSDETKKMMEKRNAIQQVAAETGNVEDWREYRGLRNKCVAAQRMDREDWERKKLSSKNSPAQMWKSVKGIVGWESSGPPTRLFHEGKSINSPSGLASTMNKFFINKVKGLRNAIPQVDLDPLANLRVSMRKRQCKFNLKLVNEQDVMKITIG